VAMNAYKKGNLKSISMKRSGSNINMDSILSFFKISEKDHELWYGDEQEANKMKKEQLEKKLYFALNHLDLGYMAHQKYEFKLKTYKIKQNPKWPYAISFFAEAKLDSLQLPNCEIGQNVELWSSILGDNPVG
jgi:hypothetical protein